ncbi:hypothetical protein M0R45_026443 [Rubus argutus]|uniref:Uncharacterized protein n=1 Tax=Rubus argutus TaxID=59490 RepID=A0AAW1WXN1_RUBAR
MNVDDSSLRFSEFQYYDSENSRDDQHTNGYMNREQDIEQKRGKNSNNVWEGTEGSLHFRGKNYEELQLVNLNGVEFRDIDEVDTFYSYYSLAMDFSVRKQKMDKDKEGVVTRR